MNRGYRVEERFPLWARVLVIGLGAAVCWAALACLVVFLLPEAGR